MGRSPDHSTTATWAPWRRSRGSALWPASDRSGSPGLAGWLLWLLVHLVFITGFKNRVAAVADWAVAFLGRGRRQRTITEQQVLTRARALAKATTPR